MVFSADLTLCRPGGRVCGEAGIWLLCLGGSAGLQLRRDNGSATWRLPSPRKESGVLLDHQTIENVFVAEAGWRCDVTGVELFQEAAHGSSGGLFADVREIRRGRAGPIHS